MEKMKYIGSIQPPDTATVTLLTNASIGVKIKKMLFALGVSAFIAIIGLGMFKLFGWTWAVWTGCILGGLLFLLLFFSSLKAQIASCPFCENILGATADVDLQANDEFEQVECPHCHEWLMSNEGELRAFTAEDLKRKDEDTNRLKFKKITAPVFQDGIWPGECILCGDKPTRTEDANKANVNLAKLLVGRLSVSTAGIKNIPYCDNHGEAVSMIIKDEEPFLVFKDYGARRRYVFINQGKKKLK